MSDAKKQSEPHLIDRAGAKLLEAKLPAHWVLREYRPDYGLDFTVETFKTCEAKPGRVKTYETLGEHVFVQLKSVAQSVTAPLTLYGRHNVEKRPERLKFADKVAELETYRSSLETPELVTVERMGIGVPVLLVIADLAQDRCSFVCLNDYIDKIRIPRHAHYRDKASRTIHVPVRNEIGSEAGQTALRWYAKRPKLLAAFQRFTYQNFELHHTENGTDWRSLANYFAQRIAAYDFWDDTEMCSVIPTCGAALRRFIQTGQPGMMVQAADLPKGFDDSEMQAWFAKQDVFHLWKMLS